MASPRRVCARLAFLFASALLPLFGAPARADDYPSHPITLIVPFAAGGSSDVNARLIAEQMSQQLGQRIIIENIASASSSKTSAEPAARWR